MKMESLSAGETKSEWRGIKDGYVIEYNSVSGLILYVFLKRPTPKEIEQLSVQNNFRIAFSEYKGVGFFCIKFGTLPWGDCAFSPNLYKTPPIFKKVEEDGYILNVIFIDTETGTIKSLWHTALGINFTKLFREWCEESLKRQMSRNWYDKTVRECYEEYDRRQLVRRANFQYEINPHGEDREREQ